MGAAGQHDQPALGADDQSLFPDASAQDPRRMHVLADLLRLLDLDDGRPISLHGCFERRRKGPGRNTCTRGLALSRPVSPPV